MQVVAIGNQKGGVGKTTVSLGLATAAARHHGARVLLVDLDPQASATGTLGVDVSDRPTMADLMLAGEPHPLDDVAAAGPWGFDVAPAEIALARFDTTREVGAELVLREALGQTDPDRWDLVVVDSPPNLGLLTTNALVAADRLVVVTEPSYMALRGVGDLLTTQDLVRRRFNNDLTMSVVVNMVDHTREGKARANEVASYFDSGVVWTPHVPRRAAVREAQGAGVALPDWSDHRGAGPVVVAFDRLAERLTDG